MKSVWLQNRIKAFSSLGSRTAIMQTFNRGTLFYRLILVYSVSHCNWIYSQSMICTQNQTECRRSACNEASSVCFHISNLLFVSLLRKWTWYNLHHDNVFQRLINASTRSFAYIFPDWEALETFVMYSALPCTNCVTLSADIIILWLMLWILSAL